MLWEKALSLLGRPEVSKLIILLLAVLSALLVQIQLMMKISS